MEYDEDQIDEEQTDKELWRSRTSGRKTLILLTSCLALLAVMLAGIYFASKSQNKTLQIVFLIFAAIAIVAGFVTSVASKLTALKWNVSNLLFILMESGFYFTGVVNQSSYFYAEWSEIASYSYTVCKNGKANVTVYFDGVADAGSYGKIKHVKLIGVSNIELFNQIFAEHNVKLDACKN